MYLANCRAIISKTGTFPGGTVTMWPYKNIEVQDPENVKFVEMADVYNSGPAAISMLTGFAERRTGANESIAKPSQILGSRTPATTALTLQQQVNRRFTPAFDQMRLATAGAVKQCLYRYQERLLADDLAVEAFIKEMLGDEDGAIVVETLRNKNFDNEIDIELTASSSSVNRDVDKQNAILLVNILMQYYQRVLELTTVAANPQIAQEVRDVARQIVEKASEVMDRVIRTFDQIRDPENFIVEMESELDGIPNISQAGSAGLQQLLGGLEQSKNGSTEQPGGS